MVVDVLFTNGPPRPLSYEVPEGLSSAAQVGCRVVAPLRNKKCIGIIWHIGADCGDSRLKAISEIIDSEPLLSGEQIEFAEWLSGYYHSSLAAVLRLFLPKLLMEPDNLLIQRSSEDAEIDSEWQAEFLDHLSRGRPIKVSTLRKKVGKRSDFYRRLAQLEGSGHLTVSFRRSRRRKTETRIVTLIATSVEKIRLGFKQKLVVYHLKSVGKPQEMSALMAKLRVSRQSIEGLADKAIVSIKSPQSGSDFNTSVQELMLNREQMDVVQTISKSVGDQEFQVFLLHGVTGSGKTEVYVKLIWDALELGMTALLLHPEIALSEQSVA